MIVLDTNVVSETFRPQPSAMVAGWFLEQAAATLFLSAPSLAELLSGIGRMPPGRRRTALAAGVHRFVEHELGTPILPFDKEAAGCYAELVVKTRSAGATISFLDAQIAAIAASRSLAVATRHTRPFLAAGLRVIDPWHPTPA